MKLKKMIAAVLLTAAAVCLMCSCEKNDLKANDEANAELPELRIGTDILEPFIYIDENGGYTGIDVDIAEEACRRAGYRPVFTRINWSARDEYLQNGSIDCLWGAFIKNGREDGYQLTDAYMQSNLRAIVNAGSPDKNIESSVEHSSIAVRAGSKSEEIFLKNDDGKAPVQVYSCGTFEMAETAFVKGYAGALCGHEAALRKVVNAYPGLYRFLDGVIMKADLAVAFPKDDLSDKCGRINTVLNEMREDGTVASIYERYCPDMSEDEEASVND